MEVEGVARMGIVMRAQDARRMAMSEHIVPSAQARVTPSAHARVTEAEQRSDRAQDPCALRVAAARGHLRCWPTSTMYTDIACGRPPSSWPRGARNAAPCTSTTDS